MKAIVGIDGSQCSRDALATVARLLNPNTDGLALYYSIPKADARSMSGEEGQVFEKARLALAKAVFNDAEELLSNSQPFGTRLTLIPGHGSPKTELVDVAQREHANLIVVGARGLGPLKRLLLGSVSRSVLHSSHLPVLLARNHRELDGHRPFNVLVAYDTVEEGERIAQFLRNLTWPAETQGRVVRVVESMFVQPLPKWLVDEARSTEVEVYAKAFVEEHDREMELAAKQTRRLYAELPEPFHGHEPIVLEGHPSQMILSTIKEEKADLVVCGARGLNAIKRTFLGSTSEYLVNHAPCSVMVVPLHDMQ